jgi:Predicted glutamine amidotransferase
MCIIIHRPTGAATRLSRETLARCADKNPDGFGLMWAHGGKLMTARYLPKQRKDFIKRALLLQSQDIPMCLHFRWATHGAIQKENTHPFVIEKGESALMHNGILSIPCVKGWSDTRTFAYEVVRGLPAGWEQMPTIRWMMEQATLGSKVAIMYASGEVTILHRKAGIVEGGIWYSNDGFRPSLSKEEWKQWVAEAQAKKGTKVISTTGSKDYVPAGVLPFRKPEAGSALAIKSGALYRFEGITICGWCLARESNTDDAIEVDAPADGEQCELCYHSPHVPGSRNLDAHRTHQMHPDCEDEGRVCTGA